MGRADRGRHRCKRFRTHRRCDRRRGRTGRLHDRVPPRPRRARRPAAGEDRLPPREGLRRRPDPARHQAARRHGHRRLRGGGLAAQQGPAHHRRRTPARTALARAGRLPRLRTGAPPRGLRRTARAAGREGRRPALRAVQRDRPRPGRPRRRPHRGRDGQTGRGETERHLPRPGGGRRRRQLLPALPRHGPAPRRQASDGRRRAHLLHQPAARRRLSGGLAGAVGPARARAPAAARLRLDLRHGRRHLQRRPRHPQQLQRLPRTGLARGAQGVVRLDARGGATPPRTCRARSAAPRCPWRSTASRTTRAG